MRLLQFSTRAWQMSTKSLRSEISPPVTSTQLKRFDFSKKVRISSRVSSSRGFIFQMLQVWHL